MARVQVLFWQEIPSVVEARDESGVHKELLSQQFQELIDLVAMRTKLAGTDEYLMHWKKGKRYEVTGAAEQVAKAVKDEYEAQYADIRERELAKAAGQSVAGK